MIIQEKKKIRRYSYRKNEGLKKGDIYYSDKHTSNGWIN